jgi:hypothetical protein
MTLTSRALCCFFRGPNAFWNSHPLTTLTNRPNSLGVRCQPWPPGGGTDVLHLSPSCPPTTSWSDVVHDDGVQRLYGTGGEGTGTLPFGKMEIREYLSLSTADRERKRVRDRVR